MVKTAFIVIRSPQELNPNEAIRRFSSREDATAILLEDGVYNALQTARAELLDGVAANVVVVRDDLEARGFQEPDLKVGRVVDYDYVVETIMERTARTVTV